MGTYIGGHSRTSLILSVDGLDVVPVLGWGWNELTGYGLANMDGKMGHYYSKSAPVESKLIGWMLFEITISCNPLIMTDNSGRFSRILAILYRKLLAILAVLVRLEIGMIG